MAESSSFREVRCPYCGRLWFRVAGDIGRPVIEVKCVRPQCHRVSTVTLTTAQFSWA